MRRRQTAEDQEIIPHSHCHCNRRNVHPHLSPAQPWEMRATKKREHRQSPPPQSKVVGIGVEELVLKRRSMVVTSPPPPESTNDDDDEATATVSTSSIEFRNRVPDQLTKRGERETTVQHTPR